MSVDDTDTTQETARRYFEAWTSRDTATARGLLADDFSFTAGDMSIEGRDAFLDAGAFPKDAETTMVDEVYQGGRAFQMYDAKRGSQIIRIVEHLVVDYGRIKSSTFVTDMAAYMALMSS